MTCGHARDGSRVTPVRIIPDAVNEQTRTATDPLCSEISSVASLRACSRDRGPRAGRAGSCGIEQALSINVRKEEPTLPSRCLVSRYLRTPVRLRKLSEAPIHPCYILREPHPPRSLSFTVLMWEMAHSATCTTSPGRAIQQFQPNATRAREHLKEYDSAVVGWTQRLSAVMPRKLTCRAAGTASDRPRGTAQMPPHPPGQIREGETRQRQQRTSVRRPSASERFPLLVLRSFQVHRRVIIGLGVLTPKFRNA
jgi:hypothetical protein